MIRLHLAYLVSEIQNSDHQGQIWSKLASIYKEEEKGRVEDKKVQMDKRTVSQDLSRSRGHEHQGRSSGKYPLIMKSDVKIV